MEKETLQQAIEEYNRYRSPRVTAELIDFSEDEFTVKFEGTFCRSCGMEEYFVDLVYQLEREEVEVEVLDFEEREYESYVVRYRIESED